MRQIAAEAHWQLGRTENHGGWFARVLSKVIDEHAPSNCEEWEECVRHAHVKNTMIQSYGYTPHQHVFGVNPSIPGDLLSEPLHIVPATAGLTEDAVAKAQAIRQSARSAVIQLQDDKSLRRALAARPRMTQAFQPGNLVAYWRRQKLQQGEVQQGGRWHRTAVVIGYVGRNLILAHRKQIFRCAPEQVRPATTEERTLIESPQMELLGIKDLIEGGTFRSHQFIDLVPGHYPTVEPSTASHAPDASGDSPMQESGEPAQPEVIDKSPADSIPPTQVVPTDVPQNMDVSPAIADDAPASGSQYGPIRRRVTGKSGDATMYRPPAMRQEDFAEIMREVVPHLLQENFESTHTGQKRSHDDEGSEEVVEPAASRPHTSSPEPAQAAGSAAEHPVSAVAHDSPNMHEESVHEVLTVSQVNDLLSDWDKHGDIEVSIAGYLAKKMSKELPPTGNPPALQEAVDDSKRTEWETLKEKNAIRFHFGKDAQRIREKYPDRFIGSRHVITRKPLEENGHVNPEDPNTFRVKSRWCLQGHLDPDLDQKIEDGLLQSPTLSQMGRNLLMQIIASNRWILQLGDIKGAFLESGPIAEK